MKESVIEDNGVLIKRSVNLPHDGPRQLQGLMMEISCLVWAQVLLDLVYQFVDEELGRLGSPSFPIPRFHFVESALAIKQLPDSHQLGKELGQVFLIEEVI